MVPPNRRHQRISGKLYQVIANYTDFKKGPCEVYSAPFAVFLNQDDTNYLEPDISVICNQDKLTDKGCSGAHRTGLLRLHHLAMQAMIIL